MKKAIYLFASLSLSACSESTEKALVRHYEQNLDGTQIDSKIDFEEFSFVKEITAADSVAEIQKMIPDYGKSEEANQSAKALEEFIQIYESQDAEYQVQFRDTYRDAKRAIAYIDQIERYSAMDPKQVLAVQYRVVYTAENPFLKAKQKIGGMFFFAPDKTRIIARERFNL